MRQHSIKTTYLIHKTLVEDDTVMEVVKPDCIHLLVAPEGTLYPYVLLTRTGIQSARGNKDFIPDVVTFNVTVYSDKYEEAADIADVIRFAVENHILQDENIRLENIELTSASEDFNMDAFEQSLNFKAEVLKPIIEETI